MNVTRVVVLGAGYAGLTAANRLAGRLGETASVTIVDPRGVFVDRIRLHELAAGADESTVVHPLPRMLNPRVRVLHAQATRIRAAERQIELADATTVAYDELVYAVGSGETVNSVPGAAEFALQAAGLDGARALRARLADRAPGAAVLVIGGGATAVELSAELATQTTAAVTIAAGSELLAGVSPAARQRARTWLTRHGVTVLDDSRVASVDQGGALTDDGRRLDADLVVWAGTFAVPTLARDSGLEVDGTGRLIVDASLRSLSDPSILGAGDACVLPEQPHLRMACATALPQGAHAADVIAASVTGGPQPQFSLGYVFLCMSLGRRDGLVQFLTRDDRPRRIVLRSGLGALVKESISRFARGSVLAERRRAGAYRWLKLGGPAVRRELVHD
ncbi:FAD-dependent oxidoreductase [Cryobacterium sp. BB307]|uniref:NAD(P)/FAD-dependent oxidoreductase n=1 Tax=Cryobacterium sp. BB307 TaxID=2716317 RepID=UPI0014486AE2|nr:FAD-dependent oxidoreductase [Cryobacterium sp. BB307]